MPGVRKLREAKVKTAIEEKDRKIEQQKTTDRRLLEPLFCFCWFGFFWGFFGGEIPTTVNANS